MIGHPFKVTRGPSRSPIGARMPRKRGILKKTNGMAPTERTKTRHVTHPTGEKQQQQFALLGLEPFLQGHIFLLSAFFFPLLPRRASRSPCIPPNPIYILTSSTATASTSLSYPFPLPPKPHPQRTHTAGHERLRWSSSQVPSNVTRVWRVAGSPV